MNKLTFEYLLEQKGPIFLDGATGSNLQKEGMPAGCCPETWILEHPDIMIALQKAYVESGTQILYAPTFTANRIKLKEYQLDDQIVSINQRLIELSKQASDGKALIAADITMTGEQLVPMGTMEFEELIDIYKEQIQIVEEAGADLLIIETMMSLQETRAAVIAAKEVSNLPIMATLTFESDGRTLYGTDAKTAAIVLEKLGVSAIGTNCSTGPDQMAAIIKDMASVTTIPLIAKPNAGLPMLNEKGETVYNMPADVFAEQMVSLVEAGAKFIGGCCGTTPEYIRLTKDLTKNLKVPHRTASSLRFITSERQTVAFSLEDRFMIVGERINPTGKKKFQEQLRNGDLSMVQDFAMSQEECGAKILDVNMGMSGIDEKQMMLASLRKIEEVTNLPLSIDSSHVEVIEAALRVYPGRALINSISLESTKADLLLPIAKKYGAMFILLPLSDEGLPKSLEEKISIIETLRQKAYDCGLSDTDIVVDGLVTTVGANKKAALETLQTIRYCKENGLATTCGLSNISFGLPERSFVNSAFLTMAIQAGLTMAIANPSQELLVGAAFASDLLLNKSEADIAYIQLMEAYKETKQNVLPAAKSVGIKVSSSRQDSESIDILAKLKKDVLKGNREQIRTDTEQAVKEGHKPKDLLDQVLLPAINEVGELFDKGKYFLPQLIASAEAMKNSIEYLEPMLLENQQTDNMPVVVIATVEGDIHDIGKNLVALMLKNYGFKVIDLGKDVPKETIIEAAKKYNAQIIALSALMTTTMEQMRHVIRYAKEENVDAKVIIGGAVITQDYADEIGADGYSKDAAEAVKLTQRLLHMN